MPFRVADPDVHRAEAKRPARSTRRKGVEDRAPGGASHNVNRAGTGPSPSFADGACERVARPSMALAVRRPSAASAGQMPHMPDAVVRLHRIALEPSIRRSCACGTSRWCPRIRHAACSGVDIGASSRSVSGIATVWGQRTREVFAFVIAADRHRAGPGTVRHQESRTCASRTHSSEKTGVGSS